MVSPDFLYDDQAHKSRPIVVPTKTLLGVLLVISTVVVVALLGKKFLSKSDFLSPLPENPISPLQNSQPSSPKEIIGFLPYWNLDEEENQRYHLLTQVAFFALEIDEEGKIKKREEDGNQQPGWTAYNSQAFGTIFRKAKSSGAKVVLTIQAADPEAINSIVNDPVKRSNAIKETMEIVETRNLDGVNIDFEFSGAPSYETTRNFTQFLREWKNALTTSDPSLLLSVDVFADSVSKVRLWEIPQVAQIVDQIVIMAYDFHRASSQVSGPIAPLRGSPEYWEYDLTKTVADFTKTVPLEKIILGVPYYGYEWQTTSEQAYATTYPGTGALATYKRTRSLMVEKNVAFRWDEVALSPILLFTESGKTHQIYYENETSLGLKYDLVNESGLGGIAIWALGYDGYHENLWNLLTEKFLEE